MVLIYRTEGGAIGVPQWGKHWLSCLNLYDWDGVNPVPPELWYVASTALAASKFDVVWSWKASPCLDSVSSIEMVGPLPFGVPSSLVPLRQQVPNTVERVPQEPARRDLCSIFLND